MITNENYKTLNQINMKIDNLLLRLKLSNTVNKTPNNLHYIRSLQKLQTEIKIQLNIGINDNIEDLKTRADSLLVVHQPETTESNVDNGETPIVSASDLEDSAQLIEDTIEKEKENEENDK